MNGNIATALIDAKHPIYKATLSKLRRAIYTTITELNASVTVAKEPIPYADRLTCEYHEIKHGEGWGGFFDCGWYHITGKLPEGVDKTGLVAILDLGGEGCVYDDNGVVQGITNVMGAMDKMQSYPGKKIVALDKLNVDSDGNIDIWVEVGNNGCNHAEAGMAKYDKAIVCSVREDVLDCYYDLMALEQAMDVTDQPEAKKAISKALKMANKELKDTTPECIAKARECLKSVMSGKDADFTVYGVGHAHLDLAWLWPIRETKRKAERTFSNALYNIDKHPEYVFGGSQPQQFEWMKLNRPSLYERMKKAEKDGRFEIQGAMWVEPDTNLPCGESLIRQCVYGKSFWKDEFGKDIDILWVPDVFGYSGALPQILNKSGVDKFMTIKLSWNNINQFPYHTFNWKGIDGSSVLVHMPPEGDYNSNGNPYAVNIAKERYKEKKVSNIALMDYGIGDGGAGPGEYHINMAKRCDSIVGLPNVKLATGKDFFTELEKNKEKYPSYQGELYLEKHQGTYTTQGKMKKYNRLMEQKLHTAEWILTMASLQGIPYPHEDMDRLWKETLLYQFHDILPGSSINRVYKECYERYPIMLSELDNIIDDTLNKMQAGGSRRLINPTPFERKGYFDFGDKSYRYDIAPYTSGELVEMSEEHFDCNEYGKNYIESDLLKVTFDSHGDIVSIIDKADGGRECLAKKAGLRIYTDMRLFPYNAWDIDFHYMYKPKCKLKLVASNTYFDGASVVRENRFKHGKSTFVQKVTLSAGCDYVKFDNHSDWHETHKMLRFDCFPSTYSDTVKCDIQFGSIDRTTKTDNSVNKAQFEIPAHKWVDVSDGEHGFALINNCKYGHRVKNGIISLNLLRSTVYPDKTADRGEHDFAFAIYPHKGAAMDSHLIERGYELNYPLVLESRCVLDQIASVDNSEIILESVFVNHANDIVLRLYESKGTEASTRLNVNIPNSGVVESDMLYDHEREIDMEHLQFTPFEIKTILIKRGQ